jgi:hypothetical protein
VVVAHLRTAVSVARRDRAATLLLAGSLAGLVLAAAGLLASGRDPGAILPADAVARVDGVAIRGDDYRRALASVAGDRRTPPDEALRRHVLDRLVDEELLVQRGLALGLARVDPRVRRELAAAVAGIAVAGADGREPTAGELAAFYAAEGAFFAGAGRLHVREVYVPADAPDAAGRAAAAAARLRAGEPLAGVQAALGGPSPVPLPDAALPPAKLADYLGPTALRTALALAPGGVGDPVRGATGFHVLVLVAREAGTPPPLDEVADEVRAEWHRRQGEEALRAYLADLRARARIETATRP